VGHELGHAFDSSKVANDMLSNTDLDRINDEYRCLVENYSNYTIAGEQNERNKTLSENVADIIGIKMAYDALRSSTSKVKLRGLKNVTDDQLFYIAVGQTWCSRLRIDTIKETLDDNRNGEPHTIDPIRVNAMMAQSTEFQKAFQCSATSKMNAQKKCTLWKREYP
jgi:predicted metalloendopeptidase